MSSVEIFERDFGADRDVARLRLVGALVVGGSSILLAGSEGGSLRWVWVFLGGLASLGWFAAYVRSRRRPTEDRLELNARGIQMFYQEKETKVTWSQVLAVSADEDRLHVRITLDGGELSIPLVWRGIGLHELAERIEHTRSSAISTKQDAQSSTTS